MPGLKKNERKYLYMIVPASVVLFLGGAAFVYFGVLPICLKFLLFAGGNAVDYTPFLTKSSYLKFILTFMLTFGVVFQLPVVLILLMRLGFLSPKTLAKYRKWAFFAIILITVLLSPTPDLPSQFLMAGPMYLLYELSIWIGYLITRERKKKVPKEKSSAVVLSEEKQTENIASEESVSEEAIPEERIAVSKNEEGEGQEV